MALMFLKSSCVTAKPLAKVISGLLEDPVLAPKRLLEIMVALSDKLVNAINKIMAQLYTCNLCMMNLEAKSLFLFLFHFVVFFLPF